MQLVARPAGRPNGITLSPNGRVLYVTNADERNVRAYDVGRSGETSNERIVIADIEGTPGGIRADEKGNLYLAAANLEIYGPDGKHARTIELAEEPSNCAFGEADLQTLLITARTTVYRIRLDVKGAVQY
jgi:gluconolactonase